MRMDLFRSNQALTEKEGGSIVMGADAELLLSLNGSLIFPHQYACPQDRTHNTEWRNTAAPKPYIADVHGDGYAWEINVHPTTCIEQLNHRLALCLTILDRRFKNANVIVPAVYEVPETVVKTAPDEVKRLGCAASINVYDDYGQPSVLSEYQRTTGCHFHFSNSWLKPDNVVKAVKWSDILAGCMWTAISPEDPKLEEFRRTAYGRAGEFRINTYPTGSRGFEYRVLPGTVLSHPVYTSLMMSLIRLAIQKAYQEGEPDESINKSAVEAINKANKDLAIDVLMKQSWSDGSLMLIKKFISRIGLPQPLTTATQWNELAWANYGYVKHYYHIG